MLKKRYALVAGLFNFINLGLGFLYVNKPWYAVAVPLSMGLLLATASWTKILFAPIGMFAVAVLELLIWFSSIAAATVIARQQRETTLSKFQKWYVYVGFFVVTSVAGNLLIANRAQLLGYEPFRFPSASMQNTLFPGDFIISDTWKYRSQGPQRGDLIVFVFPGDPTIKYLKRVIGLPGDQVEIKDGAIKINGTVLDEPYINAENNRRTSKEAGQSYNVPSDSYFVLGDNRDRSNDSRYWGFVPKNNIHGSVEFVWFSFDPKAGTRTDRIGKFVR